MGPWEVTGRRYEASGSSPTCPVREYSAQNWSTERIKITDSREIGFGGGARFVAEEGTIAELGGTDVAGGSKASGCGCDGGEVGRGNIGGGEVDRPVSVIGEVVVKMGEKIFMTGTEIRSEVCGREGATRSTGCDPS